MNEYATQLVEMAKDPEVIGATFLLGAERKEEFEKAEESGNVEQFLEDLVKEARCRINKEKRPDIFTDPNEESLLNGVKHEYESGSSEYKEILKKAIRSSKVKARGRMKDYIGWYERSLESESLPHIAKTTNEKYQTIRSGIYRAHSFILETVVELRRGSLTPMTELPAQQAQILSLLQENNLELARVLLKKTREGCEKDPNWWNLSGLFHHYKGSYEKAISCYREALCWVDDDKIRSKVLNNWATALDAQTEHDEARALWWRSHKANPNAHQPILNLLADASENGEYSDCQYFSRLVGKLMKSKKVDDSTKRYIANRLKTNESYSWFKTTKVWNSGPARWITTWLSISLVFFFLACPLGNIHAKSKSKSTFYSFTNKKSVSVYKGTKSKEVSEGFFSDVLMDRELAGFKQKFSPTGHLQARLDKELAGYKQKVRGHHIDVLMDRELAG